jgi:hypothetical protein
MTQRGLNLTRRQAYGLRALPHQNARWAYTRDVLIEPWNDRLPG